VPCYAYALLRRHANLIKQGDAVFIWKTGSVELKDSGLWEPVTGGLVAMGSVRLGPEVQARPTLLQESKKKKSYATARPTLNGSAAWLLHTSAQPMQHRHKHVCVASAVRMCVATMTRPTLLHCRFKSMCRMCPSIDADTEAAR